MRKKTTTNKDKNPCPQCTGPMVVVSKNYHRGVQGKKYRIRKFVCDLCGHEEKIYGDGTHDTGNYIQ